MDLIDTMFKMNKMQTAGATLGVPMMSSTWTMPAHTTSMLGQQHT